MRFVLLDAIGSARIAADVPESALADLLA
jgi:hypothetical protein